MKKETPLHTNLMDVYDGDAHMAAETSYMLKMDGRDHAMEKVASQEDHIPEKLEHAIRSIQQSPDPQMSYLYDRALGAGEVYGPNNNADWFGEKELRRHHDTFERCAGVYRHHKNKDPKNSIGEIMASAYNEPLSVVDLVLKIPTKKIEDEVEKLKDGGTVATSMGARVKYDVCSICGNKARSRACYCNHLRNKKLQVIDDTKVCALNPKPRFVDLSFVVIRAAPESVVLRKVAELQQKSADMTKEVPSISEDRDTIHPSCIEAVNQLDTPDAIMTAHKSYGTLRPDEFQAMLQKDASLLRPDCIPYVSYQRIEKDQYIDGQPIDKVAHAIEGIFGPSVTHEPKRADFLGRHEKIAYLRYRRNHTRDDRFLR